MLSTFLTQCVDHEKAVFTNSLWNKPHFGKRSILFIFSNTRNWVPPEFLSVGDRKINDCVLIRSGIKPPEGELSTLLPSSSWLSSEVNHLSMGCQTPFPNETKKLNEPRTIFDVLKQIESYHNSMNTLAAYSYSYPFITFSFAWFAVL